jgi:hydrogenase maturation protease
MSEPRVICFGNPWHGDDGFGHHVFLRLHEHGVDAVDAGIAGLDALPYFAGCARAVVVDAVRTGGPVGAIHRLRPAELQPPGGELSLHAVGVSGVLAALVAVHEQPPDVVLIGAEVGLLGPFSNCLSAPVEAAVPTAVRLVLRELRGGQPSVAGAGDATGSRSRT